jgi:uncharacterized membrane protein YebE (DUF533 family)
LLLKEGKAVVDINKLAGSFLSGGAATGLAGGVAGGALVSALTTKSGRKAAKSVAKIGGLAAVGALAWSAYKKYQGNSTEDASQAVVAGPQRQLPQHTVTDHASPNSAQVWQHLPQAQFDTLATVEAQSKGLLVMRTMIAAAMADGHLGPEEQKQIFKQLDHLDTQERSLLFDELRNPLSCDELAAQASDPVVAIEMYTAAALTLDMNCLVAKEFMAQLGRGLKLPDSLIASIQENSSASQLAIS